MRQRPGFLIQDAWFKSCLQGRIRPKSSTDCKAPGDTSCCPKMEAHLLGLQRRRIPGFQRVTGRSESRERVRGREDVVNAEFDVSVCGRADPVLRIWNSRTIRARRPARCWLKGTRGPLALGAASPAPPTEVAILEKVQEGLAAARERPVVAFTLIVALGPWHLRECGAQRVSPSLGQPAPLASALRAPLGDLLTRNLLLCGR